MGQSQSDICYNKCFLFKASLWEFFIKNKIKNLLGPLKMCLCDLVLNRYSIVVSLCCSFTFPFLPVLQCCSVMELQCFSATVLLCCKAIVLQCCSTKCYGAAVL